MKKRKGTDSTKAKYSAKSNVGFFLLIVAVVSFLLVEIITHYIGIAMVYGTSMLPTYHNKQVILYSPTINHISNGDVIIFSNAKTGNHQYIKRVIASGGNTIKLVNTDIYVNGILLHENYVTPASESYPEMEYTVPEGYYYVMGDNRDDSRDSRDIGLVAKEDIMGMIKKD